MLTTTVADAEYATEVLSGTPLAAVPRIPRLGVVSNPEYLDHGTAVGDAWTSTLGCLRGSGATLVDVKLPGYDEVLGTALDVQGPEAAAIHAGRDTASYQPDVQQRLREAAQVPGWRYVRAKAHAARLAATTREAMRDLDAVLMPMVPIVAPPLDATEVDGYPVRDRLLRNKAEIERRLAHLGATVHSIEDATDYAFEAHFSYAGDLKALADRVEDVRGAEVLSLGHSLQIVKDLGDAESVEALWLGARGIVMKQAAPELRRPRRA